MVKPAFEDLKVDFWVHPGTLGMAQPSICLYHDRLTDGSPILDALAELSSDPPQTQRTITFLPCARPRFLRRLKLKLEPISNDLRIMSIGFDHDTATICMTEVGLGLLKNSLASWHAGSEDFGVTPRHGVEDKKELGRFDIESGEFWFWGPFYFGP